MECPARGQRPGLRFAVADHRRDDQVWIVEGGPVGVRKRVAELLLRARWELEQDPDPEAELQRPEGESELGRNTV